MTSSTAAEEKNAFDDVSPMSQHSEDRDADMETQKVALKGESDSKRQSSP